MEFEDKHRVELLSLHGLFVENRNAILDHVV